MRPVEEEADESVYWMELLVESGFVKKQLVQSLLQEGEELTAIAVSSIKTTRKQIRMKKNRGEES